MQRPGLVPWLALPLLALLGLPVLALLVSSSPGDIAEGLRHPLFVPALLLSARTSLVSLLLVVVLGTPVAWWLARSEGPVRRVVELIVDVPIVLPPAVVGIALLQTFGRQGLVPLPLPFTTAAVVVAQVVVSSPFYVQATAAAFRRVDPDLVLVARTLGHSPVRAFWTVTLPLALPGLLGGAALAWARSLGEFGATLLFAGNLPGRTQTMPLAIYTALETDVRGAVALALVLAAVSVLLLIALRTLPGLRWRIQ